MDPTSHSSIGELLVSARSYDEYLAMFDLDPAELAGRRVLDCPGGAAGFTAGAAEAGAAATAVDPVYAWPHDELVAHGIAETHRGNAYVRANPDSYTWRYFGSPTDHLHSRLAAVDRFDADRRLVPERYLAASLPKLPFPDAAFDLALSSHLLFTYDDRLDADFHVAAARELLRVSHEVRLFPTLSMRRVTSELASTIVAALQDAGARVEVRESPYQLQCGAHDMLIARR